MNSTTPNSNDLSTATWLAAALVSLPFLQALSIDFDRSGALVLLLPALWSGRGRLLEAADDLALGAAWLKYSAVLSAFAIAVAVAVADQPAPAAATAALWLLLAAAGLLAGRVVAAEPRAGRRILGGMAGGAAAGTAAVWALWWLGGRGAVPLYAHHRHIGLHTLAGAVACTALVTGAESRRAWLGWFAAGALAWGGLLWSGGRAPMLALGGALAVWLFFTASARRPKLFGAAALQLAAGLALSLAMWTTNPELGWWHAFTRTAAAASTGNVSALTSTRSEFWLSSIERARLAPWLGHGPDAYRFLTPKLDGQQPHNFILQLWLDVGILGALPLLAILGGALWGGWPRTARAAAEDSTRLAWPVIVTAGVIAGALDGIYYHLLAFLPAALAIGVTLGFIARRNESRTRWRLPVTVLTVAAIALLAVHSWIFYALAVAEPPAPSSWRTRIVRAFPSSTFGLSRWLDAWQATEPATTLEWSRWAQTHSPNAPFFHVYAAQMLLARGDRAGAETELRSALAKAHWTIRPTIEAMLRDLPPAPH